MEQREMKELLQQVAEGNATVDEALLKMKMAPFEEIDIAFGSPQRHQTGGVRGHLRRRQDAGADRQDRPYPLEQRTEDDFDHQDEPGGGGNL